MPMIGLGTWDLRGDACKSTVKNAINLGYIHIDTAWLYQNQREIGQAINESHIVKAYTYVMAHLKRLKHVIIKIDTEKLLQEELNNLNKYRDWII